MPVTIGIAKAVVGEDTNSIRFERFCNAVVSELEGGIVVLNTSQTWDEGRDGKSRSRVGNIYTCCSLTDEVDEKARSDIKRLTRTTEDIDRIYFCSSQDLSEHKQSTITGRLVKMVPDKTSITILSRSNLIEYAHQNPKILEYHYKSEIEDCVAVLQSRAVDSDDATAQFRLALLAGTHNESQDIRSEIYQTSLRLVLSDSKPRNVRECCRDLAALLRLARNLPEETVNIYLEQLKDGGEVELASDRYTITENGLEKNSNQEANAAIDYVEGKIKIRSSIERMIGQKIIDQHYSAIWKVFQEEIATLFYIRGREMISAISLIIGEDIGISNDRVDASSSLFFIDQLAEGVAATASHPGMQEELRVAIKEIFSEKNSEGFDWLIQVCANFVAVCSLGLESNCRAAIASTISRTSLVLDTDILLSLLCAGEPDHQAVTAAVERWRRIGGGIFVAEPVLEEASHHAWIARWDFEEVRQWLPGSADDRLRLIDNAFVRAFAELMSLQTTRLRHWPRFIGQFKGRSEWDFDQLLEYLIEAYSTQLLAPRSKDEYDVERKVAKYLVDLVHQIKGGSQVHHAVDKARRDAKLYSAILRQYRVQKAKDPGASCLLVSSAKRLTEVEEKFVQVGDHYFVVPISVIVFLLSLSPEVSLGLGALKAFLFDERKVNFSSDLERKLLRVIKESEEIDMPWAKKTSLMREMRQRLMQTAEEAGDKTNTRAQIDKIEREALGPENINRTVTIMRESLDAVVADTRLERENSELRKEIEKLRADLGSS